MSAAKGNRYLEQIPLPGLEDRREGYRGPAVCKLVGITYRQLDYWTTTDLVRASVRDAGGSGTQRLYGFTDIVELKVIKRLLDTGIGLPRIRQALEFVRERGLPLEDVTLVSDGSTVYALDDQQRLIDLLQQGQGVFALAVPPVYAEVERQLSDLTPERVAPLHRAERPEPEARRDAVPGDRPAASG